MDYFLYSILLTFVGFYPVKAQSIPRDAMSIQITLWITITITVALLASLYFVISTAPNTAKDPLLNMRIRSESDKSK
ncbi:hypothetical protein cand_027510 [Cryptosporidium andersoni]|uniref:Uncharacterized protein n=1 Tax=Cryptosporidium andersoni TaxID=117008 RepID=A0A1J4MR58_9CRYT|nr:hypothetical protein cand_027510 [Cryptosporidium andersoni]